MRGVTLHEAVDADVALARVGIAADRDAERHVGRRVVLVMGHEGQSVENGIPTLEHGLVHGPGRHDPGLDRLRQACGESRGQAHRLEAGETRDARARREQVAHDRPARPPVERPEEGHGEAAVPLEALEDRGDLPGRVDRSVDRDDLAGGGESSDRVPQARDRRVACASAVTTATSPARARSARRARAGDRGRSRGVGGPRRARAGPAPR